MTRILRTRMTFRGWRGSTARASEISQRALRELAELTHTTGASLGRLQLTVAVPRGASDRAIATRIAGAVGRRVRRGTGA